MDSYVNNRAHPKGSIVEGFLAQESLTFCFRYLTGVETVFTRSIRNDDEGHQNDIEECNNLCPGCPLGRRTTLSSFMDEMSHAQAHCYVLFNGESIKHFREHKIGLIEYPSMNLIRFIANNLVSGLKKGKMEKAGYLVKGYRFHTINHVKFLKTQNNGVVVTIHAESYTSSRDRRLVKDY
uniref:DUF4218 domain-containing protein n=1 Tax=Lactuca sativa TaxID=4236 RepID=A0A9R1USZ5_LACSA|nr:hypothetical protein LSAT_V11C800410870 [Lactuca sativa]